MLTKADFLNDLILAILFSVWMFFVIKCLARWTFDFAIKKGFPEKSSIYFGRKIIHIFGSGFVTLSVPFLFKEPFIPALTAFLLAFYNFWPHKKGKLYHWFQDANNIHEVNFCIMWGIIILLGWFFDKTFWLGVIPLLFVSFGDGVTGIVRNLKYKKKNKGWEGSLAMLICCILIGAKLGLAGVVAAILATIVEKILPMDNNLLDDNIWIPLVSFLTLFLFQWI